MKIREWIIWHSKCNRLCYCDKYCLVLLFWFVVFATIWVLIRVRWTHCWAVCIYTFARCIEQRPNKLRLGIFALLGRALTHIYIYVPHIDTDTDIYTDMDTDTDTDTDTDISKERERHTACYIICALQTVHYRARVWAHPCCLAKVQSPSNWSRLYYSPSHLAVPTPPAYILCLFSLLLAPPPTRMRQCSWPHPWSRDTHCWKWVAPPVERDRWQKNPAPSSDCCLWRARRPSQPSPVLMVHWEHPENWKKRMEGECGVHIESLRDSMLARGDKSRRRRHERQFVRGAYDIRLEMYIFFAAQRWRHSVLLACVALFLWWVCLVCCCTLLGSCQPNGVVLWYSLHKKL